MSLVNGNWYYKGWGQKLVALGGLTLLGCLNPQLPTAAVLATFGTAYSVRTLARHRTGLKALLWILFMCALFAGWTTWWLHRWVPGSWVHLYMAALALMVIVQDEFSQERTV